MIEDKILELVKEVNPDNPISFVHNLVKPFAKQKLDNYILECEDCDICKTKKTITKGNPNASVLIIGESSTEDQQNYDNAYPFDNESGKLLFKALKQLNINIEQLFFANSVNCFPHREHNGIKIKRAPTKTERTNCKVFLDYTIKMVEPLLIICLGGVATNDINEEIGKHNISKIRGSYFMYHGVNVMPTYNPGYFIELEKSKKLDEETIIEYQWDFFNDLKKAFSDLQKQYPDLNIINKEK